jgi:hypothetical protein
MLALGYYVNILHGNLQRMVVANDGELLFGRETDVTLLIFFVWILVYVIKSIYKKQIDKSWSWRFLGLRCLSYFFYHHFIIMLPTAVFIFTGFLPVGLCHGIR